MVHLELRIIQPIIGGEEEIGRVSANETGNLALSRCVSQPFHGNQEKDGWYLLGEEVELWSRDQFAKQL